MLKKIFIWASMLAISGPVLAQDPVDGVGESSMSAAEESTEHKEDAEIPSEVESPADPKQPRAMSGMSILGNEEAPKALVIVPWKTSEMGADLELSDSLDDRARPVDREVFMRELSYYELRSANGRAVVPAGSKSH